MRPLLIEFLNSLFRTEIFTILMPTPTFLYALAMIVGLIIFICRCSQVGISRYHSAGAALWMMIGGLIGSRILYLLYNLQHTLSNPQEILNLWGGTVSWGAYLGGLIGMLVYCHQYRQSTLKLGDVIVSYLGLGIAIGRWGCFLNGDDFGRLSTLPWAVRYPPGSYPFLTQVQSGILDPNSTLSLPVHPVQLYLSINGLLLFIITSRVWQRLQHRAGIAFGFFWISYGISRFLLEFTRGDHPNIAWGLLTPGQVACIIVVIISMFWMRNQMKISSLKFKIDTLDFKIG